ncbi:MAG: hypothetical protein ABW061_16835 [Polyangiaceae bacterium]
MLHSVCASAIADGVISCVVFDASTGEPREGIDRGGLEGAAALFDLLRGIAPVRGPEPEPGSNEPQGREVLIVGAQQSAFACVTSSRRWLVLIVAPSSLSVALGWSLLRRVAAASEVAA